MSEETDFDITGLSRSYFWSCVTLNEDCPLFSNNKLFYFGVGLLCMYSAFLLIILCDLHFFWSLDKFQNQIGFYINLVRKKVRRVQMDQRRLVSMQERTEKQLKKTVQSQRVVNAMRQNLLREDLQDTSITSNEPRQATWSECHSVIDF